MNHLRVKTSIILTVVFALTACNLPSQATPEPGGLSPEEIAGTMVAQTAQAGDTDLTATPTSIPPSATPSAPSVTVSIATNCRTGPNPGYPFVMLFDPTMTAPVVGKHTPSGYWIITMPNGGTCWLWGNYATVRGDPGQLPEMTPPTLVVNVIPTEVVQNPDDNSSDNAEADSNDGSSGNTNSGDSEDDGTPLIVSIITPMVFLVVPNAPTSLKVASYCQYAPITNEILLRTDTLTWSQVDNAEGYIIYLNGSELYKVSNKTLGYQISESLSPTATSYGIAAYIGSVSSKIRTTTAKGCQ